VEKELYYACLDSPVGRLGLAATSKGLVSLDFVDLLAEDYGVVLKKQFPGRILAEISEKQDETAEPSPIERALEELKEYFAGKRQEFTCPLDLGGTSFQKKVWQALREIPYGETVSYEAIAEKIGNIKAVRAVGQANGKNPVAIIVPCHRVIRKSGDLGGYSSGLEIKRFLLGWEEQNKNG